MKNRRIWNELHKDERHQVKYPSENVIRFVRKNFRCDGTENILDLGCGAGRHLVYLAEINIVPWGGDFSASGVACSKEMLERYGYGQYCENVLDTTSYDLPFNDNFFDGLICWGVLYYMDIVHIRESVKEIERVLKRGALALVLIRTVNDYRYRDAKLSGAKEIEDNTFFLSENDATKSAVEEDGMLMHFFTKDEVEEIFVGFTEVSIDTVTQTYDNGSYQDQDFLVFLRK